MDEAFSKFAELDDFQVITERLQVMDTIAALTDKYRQLPGPSVARRQRKPET